MSAAVMQYFSINTANNAYPKRFGLWQVSKGFDSPVFRGTLSIYLQGPNLRFGISINGTNILHALKVSQSDRLRARSDNMNKLAVSKHLHSRAIREIAGTDSGNEVGHGN